MAEVEQKNSAEVWNARTNTSASQKQAREKRGPGNDLQEKTKSGTTLSPRAMDLVKQATFLATSYASEDATHLRAVLGALKTLIDSVAGWPGYKAIVYMGDGMPDNAAEPYIDRILAVMPSDNLSTGVAPFSLTSELDALLRAAAASNVIIHTLQTRGLETGSGWEMLAAHRRSNSLEMIALNTGGLASSSNNFLEALNDFETSGRAFYVLGYQPQGPPDGRFHAVQVRCRKRDSRLRWRMGFTRPKPEEARQRQILAAYTVPEMYAQMAIGLTAVPGPADPSERIMDLVLHVPGDSVMFLPEGGRPTAHLDVGLVAVDEARHEMARMSRSLTIALRPEQGRPGQVGINLVRRVRLSVKSQSVTAVVSDAADGMVGGARLDLPAGAPESGGILGLSIYSLKEKSIWVELPDGEADRTSPGPAGESAIGPALKSSYTPGEPLVCGFRMPASAASGGSTLQIAIRLGAQTLKTVTVGPQDFRAGETVHVLLPVESLPPGDYTLAIQEVLAEGTVDRSTAPLAIRTAAASPLGLARTSTP